MPGSTVVVSHSSSNRSRIVLLIIATLAAGKLMGAPPESYRFLSLTEATQQANSENKPMLLYFGRYGCSTCRKMHAEVFSDAALNAKYDNDFVLAYVDTESGARIKLANGERITEMQFASRSRIIGTPTFVYFAPGQKALFKKAGFQSIGQMNLYADYILENHYQSIPLQQFIDSQ